MCLQCMIASFVAIRWHCCVSVMSPVSLIDWISDTRPQGCTDLQSLVKCLDHRYCGRYMSPVCHVFRSLSAANEHHSITSCILLYRGTHLQQMDCVITLMQTCCFMSEITCKHSIRIPPLALAHCCLQNATSTAAHRSL